MDKLIPSLIVAALSALTWLAYKHPPAFKMIAAFPMIAVTLIYVAFAIWEFGVSKGYSKMLEFLKPGSFDEAQKQVDELRVLTGWHGAAVFCFNLYMVFLINLPAILRD
ncbi:MAG: hypothetical protein KIT48_15785 [Pseudolabrys sp.]|nr:hypothetical protein [Pseudolabrys sp.]